MRGLQFAEDASPMAANRSVPDMVIEMNNFYTLTVYEKGAEVIRMIHTLAGRRKLPERDATLFPRRHDGSAGNRDDLCRRWKMRRMSISPISAVGTASPARRL